MAPVSCASTAEQLLDVVNPSIRAGRPFDELATAAEAVSEHWAALPPKESLWDQDEK